MRTPGIPDKSFILRGMSALLERLGAHPKGESMVWTLFAGVSDDYRYVNSVEEPRFGNIFVSGKLAAGLAARAGLDWGDT